MTLILPQPPALSGGESQRPDLWNGCMSLWAPCMTGRFSTASVSRQTRSASVPDLGQNKLGLRINGLSSSIGISPYGPCLSGTGSNGIAIENTAVLDRYNFVHQMARFSVSALVYPTTVSTLGIILDSTQGSTTTSGMYLGVNNTGMVIFAATRGSAGNNVATITASRALLVNTWNHILVTGDGAFCRLWVNGVKYATDTAVSTLGASNQSFSLGVGSYGGGVNSQTWSGKIAYVGVWNRPLNGDVAQIFASDHLAMFRRKQERVGKSISVAVPSSYIIIHRRRRIM